MAAKAHLRNQKPLIIGLCTNANDIMGTNIFSQTARLVAALLTKTPPALPAGFLFAV